MAEIDNKQYGTCIYYYGKEPKLTGIVTLKSAIEDPTYWIREIRLVTMDGKRLNHLREYSIPSDLEKGGKQKFKHRIKCYKDFYVIESSYEQTAYNNKQYFFEAYDYEGSKIKHELRRFMKSDAIELGERQPENDSESENC